MEYVTLGSTGTRVSRFCLGTAQFGGQRDDGTTVVDRETAHDLLDAFAARGGNFVDTANIYGHPNGESERIVGDWLADRDREDVVVASKVVGDMGDGPNESGLGRKHVRAQIEGTLDRLGTDYLDLYYVHWWDEATPARQVMRTLTDLVREGKVNHLGASNTAAWRLTKALWESDAGGLERFEVIQPRFNAAWRETPADNLDLAADQRLGVCPYSPLEGGLLTGKYERDADAPPGSRGARRDWTFEDRQWNAAAAVEDVAAELDATPAQVALRWLVERERFTCVPIVGATSVGQLEENVGATELSLSAAQRERITEAYRD